MVMVLHDLNLAARYADHLVVMRGGAVVAEGAPGEVVSADLLRDVFGVEAEIFTDPATGAPLVIPLGLRREETPVLVEREAVLVG